MKKLTKVSFRNQVISEGSIAISEKYNFVVTQINNENFRDIHPKLEQQLKDEGKYNSWIGFVTSDTAPPYSTQMLPIFGDPNKYVTKWFKSTAEQIIEQDLKDRDMQLLKRANEYIGY